MTRSCTEVLKDMPQALAVEGFSISEMSRAICRSMEYFPESEPLPQAIAKSRTTLWPGIIEKAVMGGLQHVISADNAAAYAELWHKGGSYYAVTGADPDGNTLKKSGHWVIYQIPGVNKGASLEEATARFLATFFPPSLMKSAGGCGCKAGQAQQSGVGTAQPW